jgi:hypothetical protein
MEPGRHLCHAGDQDDEAAVDGARQTSCQGKWDGESIGHADDHIADCGAAGKVRFAVRGARITIAMHYFIEPSFVVAFR